MQGGHDEIVSTCEISHPSHAMGSGFVTQLDRLPELSTIRRRHEVKDGSTVHGVSRIPLGTDGDLAFAVAIDVTGGNADVVFIGKFFGNDVLLPLGVLIPDDHILISQKDIRSAIAVHICQS
jgi:hypothetical protein